MKVGLSREDALYMSKCIVDVNLIANWLRRFWPPFSFGDTTTLKGWTLPSTCHDL